MGAFCALFLFLWARTVPIFCYKGEPTVKNMKTRYLTQAAIIAALYAVLTHMQNLLLPGSASMTIQMRISEAMCILAFFTPAAVPGLTLGCLLFNLTFAETLPLDWVVGTLASFIAVQVMWSTRKITIKGYPLLGMLMPALSNAVLVGWELTYYFGGGFFINALYVAIGEAVVLLVLGTILFYAFRARHLDEKLFVK